MSDSPPEEPRENRPARRDRHFVQDADLHLPERRPCPLDRVSDPFAVRPAVTAQRRVVVGDRTPPAPRILVVPAEEPLDDAPKGVAAIDRDLLLDELVGATPLYRPAPTRRPTRTDGFPWLLLSICVASLTILLLFWRESDSPRFCFAPGCMARAGVAPAEVVTAPGPLPTAPGQHSVLGPPTMSAQQIDRVLAQWGSPATGTGASWVALGARYGIDPVYALAFFVHESGAGTAPGWAGLKSGGGTTHNVGNIICAGYPTCYGRFRDYGSWEEGIEDWYRLIAVEYVGGRGVHTVEEIIPIYAPSVENNVPAYVETVNRLVAEWRASGAR